MRNWKTTLSGIVTTIGYSLAQNDNPTYKLIGEILTGLGLVFMGASGKDHDVTGR